MAILSLPVKIIAKALYLLLRLGFILFKLVFLAAAAIWRHIEGILNEPKNREQLATMEETITTGLHTLNQRAQRVLADLEDKQTAKTKEKPTEPHTHSA